MTPFILVKEVYDGQAFYFICPHCKSVLIKHDVERSPAQEIPPLCQYCQEDIDPTGATPYTGDYTDPEENTNNNNNTGGGISPKPDSGMSGGTITPTLPEIGQG